MSEQSSMVMCVFWLGCDDGSVPWRCRHLLSFVAGEEDLGGRVTRHVDFGVVCKVQMSRVALANDDLERRGAARELRHLDLAAARIRLPHLEPFIDAAVKQVARV